MNQQYQKIFEGCEEVDEVCRCEGTGKKGEVAPWQNVMPRLLLCPASPKKEAGSFVKDTMESHAGEKGFGKNLVDEGVMWKVAVNSVQDLTEIHAVVKGVRKHYAEMALVRNAAVKFEKDPEETRVIEEGLVENLVTEEVLWLMQRRKDNKRQRSPTPRRRRIPARGRVQFEPSQRQMRRSSWMQNPERPTSSASWAAVPWRRSRNARAHSRPSRPTRAAEAENEELCEEEPQEHPNASSSHMPSAPPLPPFEEGIRTWGELIGILDPMDEAEQIIDPLVVTSGVDRIRRMSEEERAQLAIQLVRFLAILQMVDQDDVTVLLQLPATTTRTSLASPGAWADGGEDDGRDDDDDHPSLMHMVTDKFGVMLQQLLGLLEKMGQPLASMRASFLLSMLADIQRPGTHVSAVVIEKMDRLQALLLSFDEGVKRDMEDEDRDWCLRQWDILRPALLDKKREAGASAQHEESASSSNDIVFLEDSQEAAEECGHKWRSYPTGPHAP